MPHIETATTSLPAFMLNESGHLSGSALVGVLFGVIILAQIIAIGIFVLLHRAGRATDRAEAVNGMHLAFAAAAAAERERAGADHDLWPSCYEAPLVADYDLKVVLGSRVITTV